MTRIRDRGSVGSTTWTVTLKYLPNGSTSVFPWNYSWSNPDLMVDIVTPGFKKLSSEGTVINSAMSKTKGVLTPLGLSASESAKNGSWVTTHTGYFPRAIDISGLLGVKEVADKVSRVEAMAITAAYAEVGSANVDALTEIAEIKETLAFLMSPVAKMVTLTHRARGWLKMYERIQAAYAKRVEAYAKYRARLRPGQVPRPPPDAPKIPPFKVGKISATDLPSFWLAYRYGLMPLIYTFQGIEKNLKAQVENAQKNPPRATARAKWEEKLPSSLLSTTASLNVGGASFPIQRSLVVKDSRVASRAGVLYVPQLDFRTQWGLHIHYIPLAAYEVIPLSFVADWFYSGSEAYKALTAHLRAVKMLAAWVSTQVDITGDDTDVLGASSTATASPSKREFAHVDASLRKRRTANISDVRVQLKIDLNAYRIADGLALVFNFFQDAGRKRK